MDGTDIKQAKRFKYSLTISASRTKLENMAENALVRVACALPLVDLFNLQQTSKCVRDVTAKSGQWERAFAALEREFPFSDEVRENVRDQKWRKLNEPRLLYSSKAWVALSPLSRFAKMVCLGQVMTKDVEHIALRFASTTGYLANIPSEELLQHHGFGGYNYGTIAKLLRDPARLQLTRTLAALSFFDQEMRSGKDAFGDGEGWALPYDLEDELSEPGSFPGGSGGRDAIFEYYCVGNKSMGSPEHLAELISPSQHPAVGSPSILPFSQQERQLLGSKLVHSLHIDLCAWMGQLADVWGVNEATARTRVERLHEMQQQQQQRQHQQHQLLLQQHQQRQQQQQQQQQHQAVDDGEDDGRSGSTAGAAASVCTHGMSCFRKNPAHFAAEAHPANHPMLLHRSPHAQPRYPVSSDSSGGTTQQGAAAKKRPKCQYASSCYRKNPQHKKECRHPNDSDWTDDEE
jgi:hypothetical protein